MSRISLRSLFLMAAVFPLGCRSIDVASMFERKTYLEAGPKNPVVDVVCLWEPGEGRGLDNLPARGFAAQLLFLTRGSDLPAKVDGDIRIYIFDDQGPVEEQAKPIRQFDFGSRVFNRYFRETSFGSAYQLFLPYTRKGAHEAHCELRVRFTPADGGPPVYSRMADITLPGAKPTSSDERRQPGRHQLRADAEDPTDMPLSARRTQSSGNFSDRTGPSLSRTMTSIPLTTDSRTVLVRSRLQRLAAQMAESDHAEESDEIQQASYETEEPARRHDRLHSSDR